MIAGKKSTWLYHCQLFGKSNKVCVTQRTPRKRIVSPRRHPVTKAEHMKGVGFAVEGQVETSLRIDVTAEAEEQLSTPSSPANNGLQEGNRISFGRKVILPAISPSLAISTNQTCEDDLPLAPISPISPPMDQFSTSPLNVDTKNGYVDTTLSTKPSSSKSTERKLTIPLTAAQFRRHERMNRRAEVALDVARGNESFKPSRVVKRIAISCIAVPLLINFIAFGIIPYEFSNNNEGETRPAWYTSLFPWFCIALSMSFLFAEVYSNIISEIEFSFAVFSEDQSFFSGEGHRMFLLIASMTVSSMVVLQAILHAAVGIKKKISFYIWPSVLVSGLLGGGFTLVWIFLMQRRAALQLYSSGGSTRNSDSVGESRDSHSGSGKVNSKKVSGSEIVQQERRVQLLFFLKFIGGLALAVGLTSAIYTVVTILHSAFQASARGFVGYLLIISMPILRDFLLYTLNYSWTEWGCQRGQLCDSLVGPAIIYTIHYSFVSLVVAVMYSPGELAVLSGFDLLLFLVSDATVKKDILDDEEQLSVDNDRTFSCTCFFPCLPAVSWPHVKIGATDASSPEKNGDSSKATQDRYLENGKIEFGAEDAGSSAIATTLSSSTLASFLSSMCLCPCLGSFSSFTSISSSDTRSKSSFDRATANLRILTRLSLMHLLGTVTPILFLLSAVFISAGPNYRLFQGSYFRIVPFSRNTDGVFKGARGHFLFQANVHDVDVLPTETRNIEFVVKLVLYSIWNAIILLICHTHSRVKGWNLLGILSAAVFDHSTLLLRGSISLSLLLVFSIAFQWFSIN